MPEYSTEQNQVLQILHQICNATQPKLAPSEMVSLSTIFSSLESSLSTFLKSLAHLAKLEMEERSCQTEEVANDHHDQDEIAKLKQKVTELNSTIKELHQIIIKTHRPDAEHEDRKIAEDYRTLRRAIEAVVIKYYQRDPPNLPASPTENQKKAFAGWSERSKRIRAARARELIFNFLKEDTFDRPRFGLDDQRERCMGRFEQEMQNFDIPEMDLIEWRKRTVSIASLLDSKADITSTRDQIKDFMEPVVNLHQECAEADCDKRLLAICEQALDLALRFRRNRVTYSIKTADANDSYNDAEMLEIERDGQETENGEPVSSSISLKVSFTVFGALIKTTSHLSHGKIEKLVLEKADVVTTLI
ncbi:MAG: hypothetical protein M1840_008883 [Geoglossum simile]|nr:MAG: hypothetical protein M1840_008883 [Geoglossum simile]